MTTSSNVTSLSISSNGISQASASGSNVFMGKVGLGTNNPAEQLHVLGNARVDGTNILSALTLGNETRTNWPTGSLSATNNLSDITDQAAARANLGLGTAATSDASLYVATNGSGAHLTGITAAQVGALAASSNLLDVVNKAIARTNLGLGSAATYEAGAFLSPNGDASGLTNLQLGSSSVTGDVTFVGNLTVGGWVAESGGIAAGLFSHADSGGQAYSNYSHADSYGWANGEGAHADSGGGAFGVYSHADGLGMANGAFAHADSYGEANGTYSHADSDGVANGDYTHAEGLGTANGAFAHADSGGTTYGVSSHADSFGHAHGDNSHADSSSWAIGEGAHADSGGDAWGISSHADSGGGAGGNSSHADSYGWAAGQGAHADSGGAAFGMSSHAEGLGTANGAFAHAAGLHAIAIHDNTYVWSDGTYAESTTNQQYTVYAANGIRLLGGPTEIAHVVPQGDLSMGTYTNGF